MGLFVELSESSDICWMDQFQCNRCASQVRQKFIDKMKSNQPGSNYLSVKF